MAAKSAAPAERACCHTPYRSRAASKRASRSAAPPGSSDAARSHSLAAALPAAAVFARLEVALSRRALSIALRAAPESVSVTLYTASPERPPRTFRAPPGATAPLRESRNPRVTLPSVPVGLTGASWMLAYCSFTPSWTVRSAGW